MSDTTLLSVPPLVLLLPYCTLLYLPNPPPGPAQLPVTPASARLGPLPLRLSETLFLPSNLLERSCRLRLQLVSLRAPSRGRHDRKRGSHAADALIPVRGQTRHIPRELKPLRRVLHPIPHGCAGKGLLSSTPITSRYKPPARLLFLFKDRLERRTSSARHSMDATL